MIIWKKMRTMIESFQILTNKKEILYGKKNSMDDGHT